MLIERKFYQFTGKKLMAMVEDYHKQERAMNRAANKFSKEVGAKHAYVDQNWALDSYVVGFGFEKPDRKLWREHPNGCSIWIPKKNSKEAKALYERFKGLPRASIEPIRNYVGFKTILDGSRLYRYSFFTNGKGFAGVCVPICTNSKEFKPARGMKEISWKTYVKKMGIKDEDC